jgi:hypothetical protein
MPEIEADQILALPITGFRDLESIDQAEIEEIEEVEEDVEEPQGLFANLVEDPEQRVDPVIAEPSLPVDPSKFGTVVTGKINPDEDDDPF